MLDALPSVGGLLPLMSRSSLHPFLLPPDESELHVCIRTSSFHSLVSSILLMCGDAFLLLQSCLALSVLLCPFVLSSYFLLSQYVLPFRMALLRMIAILVHLAKGVCDSVKRLFILLLSVFLRVEGVMDCLSVASAEVYSRSCILSFLCRSFSNWVVGCRLWL